MTLFGITAATILALTTNASVNGKYVYNIECNNNVVSSQTVYTQDMSGKYLTQKLKYNFTYDAEKRLTSKETLRWNAESGKWENYKVQNYTYGTEGYSVELAYWNKTTQQYSDVMQKCEYSVIGDNVLEVATYNWNKETKSFELASREALYQPTGAALFAESK